MSTVKFNCPHCQQRLGVDSKLLGQKIGCPTCSGHIKLPALPVPANLKRESEKPPATPVLIAPPAPMAAAIPVNKVQAFSTTVPITLANGDITFPCTNCGCKLIVTERAAGKQIPCRRCGEPVIVPEVSLPPDPAGRQTINMSVGSGSQQHIAQHIEKLRTGDMAVIKNILGYGVSAVSQLIDQLENSFDDPTDNRSADRIVEALVLLGDLCTKQLIGKLGRSRRAYIALGRIGSKDAIEALIRELTSVNWRRAEAACLALGLVESVPDIPAVILHLESTRKATRVGEVFTASGSAITTLQQRLSK